MSPAGSAQERVPHVNRGTTLVALTVLANTDSSDKNAGRLPMQFRRSC